MLPAKSFYMIRHGQTVDNAARIAAGGQRDSALNDIGIKQAKTLARYIDQLEEKPEIIYHSDMQRARNTAKFINEALGLEMVEEHNLREHDLGGWDGLHWDEVMPCLENKEKPEGGEHESEFVQRIQSTITNILEQEERLVMIVAHGGLFHALGSMYEYGISPIQNCHLHRFNPYNDHSRFPWQVLQYDIVDGGLNHSPAPFCFSQAMEELG